MESRQAKFSKRVENIEVSAIKQMPLHARSVDGAISLGQGIPSASTPSYIREQVIDWLRSEEQIGKYSLQPGMPELKELVAGVVSEKAKRAVDPEKEVFISAGAMEALFASMLSLIEEGDEVILFDPSYASHIEQVVFAGGRPVYVPLKADSKWSLCQDSLQSAITPKTKAIVVCSPGNPTGRVFSEEELSFIVKVAAENELFVFADETYDFLVYDDLPYRSLSSYPEIKDYLIACYSFSKQFAMTGWRVGYMYAPEDVVSQTLKVHDAAVICAPTISQYAAIAALKGAAKNAATSKSAVSMGHSSAQENNLKDVLEARRELMCRRLDEVSDLFAYTRPEGTYYIFARYLKTDLSSQEMAMKILHEARVITIPGRAFGPQGEGFIRLSFGGTEAEINEALDRIAAWNQTL